MLSTSANDKNSTYLLFFLAPSAYSQTSEHTTVKNVSVQKMLIDGTACSLQLTQANTESVKIEVCFETSTINITRYINISKHYIQKYIYHYYKLSQICGKHHFYTLCKLTDKL